MALEERLKGVEDRVETVEQKVDQVRAVFGLNGRLSPEAAEEAATTWRELRGMAKRDLAARTALGMDESPEVMNDVIQSWKDMVEIVKRDRVQRELRASYREVGDDLARRFRWLRHPWNVVRWVIPLVAGALAWRLAYSLHVPTPWGHL